jgi:hypothetical protein
MNVTLKAFIMRMTARFHSLVLGHAATLVLTGSVGAAEVQVMISGGLTAAYKALVPEFERSTGHKVLTAYGPSMGTNANAIPVHLERGEPADQARQDRRRESGRFDEVANRRGRESGRA